MAKDKKKKSKQDQPSEDLLEIAHTSLKKFRKVTREISKLSTGQKLVGGLALAAAGLAYLAIRDAEDAAVPAATAAAPLSLPDGDLAKPKHDPAPSSARPGRKAPKA